MKVCNGMPKVLTVALTIVSMVGANLALAANLPSPSQTTHVSDVKLGAEGSMLGRVVDAQGRAQAGVPVAIAHNGKEIAKATSNKDGFFAVKGLRGGLHQVSTGKSVSTTRLWTAQAAPPSAQQGLMVVSGGNVVNGQCCDEGCGGGSACCCPAGMSTGAMLWNAGNTALGLGALTVAIIALTEDDGASP